ncbi:MAG: ABC transporter ATP-binding protein, partial [Pseudomonadota bacterium]
LDIETLDLLQELLADFDGTVLFVSHDRDFIDRVATSVIAMEGDGAAVEYAGGWSDYRSQRASTASEVAPPPGRQSATATAKSADRAPKAREEKLSFTETHRLEALPAEMERIEAEIAKLEAFLSDPDLYAAHPAKFAKASEALAERRAALASMEEEWLELEAKREALA